MTLLALLFLAVAFESSGAPPQAKSGKKAEAPTAVQTTPDCDCKRYAIYGCPLYPVANYPGGTLYFAEHFAPDCDAESQVTYVYGDYDWPWEICPDDCGELYKYDESPPTRAKAANDFEGLPEPVPLDYMHEYSTASASASYLAGRRGGQSCFPGGPARRCCRVNKDLNNLFLSFKVDGDKRYAKILQLEVNVEMAAGLPDKDHWRATYVAFEVEDDPASSGGEVIAAQNFEDVSPASNDYVKRAKFRKGPGQLAEALILLGTDE